MQKNRKNKNKRKKKIKGGKRKQYAKTKKRTRLKRIGDFDIDSILSSQFASSTLHSLHSGMMAHEHTANSTVHCSYSISTATTTPTTTTYNDSE